MLRVHDSSLGPVVAVVFAALLLPHPVGADSGPAQTGWTASANSASAGLFNPAGLVRMEQSELEIGLMTIRSESELELSATGLSGSRLQESSGTFVIPSFYYSHRQSDRWAFGLSLAATGGLGAVYDSEWAGRYFLQEWSLGYGGLTGSAGWQASEHWSVGLGINISYTLYSQESAVLNLEPGSPDGQLAVDADGIVPTATLGVLWEPRRGTRFGAVYTSEGDSKLTGSPEYSGIGPVREALLTATGVISRDIEIEGTNPARGMVGLYHEQPGGLTFTVDLLWMDFSEYSLSQLSVADDIVERASTEYQDMYGGSVGVRVPAGKQWKLLAGVVYVSSAVKDENRTFTLRLDQMVGAGVGIQRTLGASQGLGVNLNYYRVGDAPVVTAPLPGIGSVTGETTESGALMLDVSWSIRL